MEAILKLWVGVTWSAATMSAGMVPFSLQITRAKNYLHLAAHCENVIFWGSAHESMNTTSPRALVLPVLLQSQDQLKSTWAS